MTTECVITHSPEETHELARAVLARLPGPAVLALHGELGAGKTCFVQGLALALGIDRAVTSPTFIMINEYRGARPLYHMDLYRIRGPDDALALGLDDYLHGDGIAVIEWAERAVELIPPGAVHLRFRALEAPDEREITVEFPTVGAAIDRSGPMQKKSTD